MLTKFKAWCGSNSKTAKCTRTIFQGIVGVLIAYLPDLIAGSEVIPNVYKPIVVATLMACLSPIQASLGTGEEAEG